MANCSCCHLDLQGPTMPPPGYSASNAAATKTKQQQPSGSNIHAAAAARVAASIALLTGHQGGSKGRPREGAGPGADEGGAGYDDEEEQQQWLPPADQSGDGQTSLNAKLGY